MADMIANADVDGNQTLEFNEFLNLMLKAMHGNADEEAKTEELKEAFKVFDKNNDSFISR